MHSFFSKKRKKPNGKREAQESKSVQDENENGQCVKGVALSDARSFIAKNGDWLERVPGSTSLVRCKICTAYSDAANKASFRMCPFAKTSGVKFLSKRALEHHFSDAHEAALNAYNFEREVREKKQSNVPFKSSEQPLLKAVSHVDKVLYKNVLNRMYDVYNDWKVGTLSAWSWASRRLTRHFAETVSDFEICVNFD